MIDKATQSIYDGTIITRLLSNRDMSWPTAVSMSQNTLDLDASKWRSCLDFYRDILQQIGAPEWHGESVAALVDSIIYGGINSREAPYRIRVSGSSDLTSEVLDEVRAAKDALDKARRHKKENTGRDVDVQFELT